MSQAASSLQIRGRYVLILDDDDRLCNPEAIARLKKLAALATPGPDVIVFKAWHDRLGLLPTDRVFTERQPYPCEIGSCDLIIERELWRRNIRFFDYPKMGDYKFIEAVFQENPLALFCNEAMAEVMRISEGAPE